jgi:hypothetical protein
MQLYDDGGSAARSALGVTVPPKYRQGDKGPLALPQPAWEGYLFKIVSTAADHLCRGYILVDDDWRQIGDAYEVPARASRVEVKTGGGKLGQSRLWFDDCRLYPRPESHYVSVSLRRPDDRSPGTRNEVNWPPSLFNSNNEKVSLSDVQVRLYSADGTVLVDEVDVGQGFGYALLKLVKAPWDLYPAPALIRVFFKDEQIGPDHLIKSGGVDGLYPDDVYTITLY